jgi:hypothetical protein
LVLAAPLCAAGAENVGTPDEAKAMLERGVVFYKANGKDKFLAEVNNPKGQFVDRDLYIAVWTLDGIRIGHPHNPKLLGTSVLDAIDFDGKAYGKEIIETAKTAGSGAVTYKFTEPTTKKLAEKTTYVVKVDDIVLGCGAYKQ